MGFGRRHGRIDDGDGDELGWQKVLEWGRGDVDGNADGDGDGDHDGDEDRDGLDMGMGMGMGVIR